MQIYNDHHYARTQAAHADMDGVAWIGLGLSLLGLAGFGAYTVFPGRLFQRPDGPNLMA